MQTNTTILVCRRGGHSHTLLRHTAPRAGRRMRCALRAQRWHTLPPHHAFPIAAPPPSVWTSEADIAHAVN